MVDVEVIGLALDNEPWLVSRKDSACAMEFLDVKSAGLSSCGSVCDLK